MKVKELMSLLTLLNPEYEVVIPVVDPDDELTVDPDDVLFASPIEGIGLSAIDSDNKLFVDEDKPFNPQEEVYIIQ